MTVFPAAVVALAFVWWGFQLLTLVRVTRAVPRVEALPPGVAARRPSVSAVLTARNEERSLEEAVRARLEDPHPGLEVIIVDDRSTDRTGEIADQLAASDARVKVVHVRELPPGWLGKLNALQQGLAVATGEWVLFSDGDVSVHREVLDRVLTHCEHRQLDHCVLVPRMLPVNPMLDAVTSVFMRLVALNLRNWALEDPGASASVGIGAFNLFRRSALERTPGLAWLKLEVADDVSLGQMLKSCGARQSAVNGCAMAELTFHRSLKESLVSAERATFTAIGNFSLARLVALAAAMLALELSPLVALALARTGPQTVAALGASALAVATMVMSNRWSNRSSWHLVLTPLAELIIAYSQVRAGVLGTLRGGIAWRGTFYPTAALKAGRRFGRSWAELRRRP